MISLLERAVAVVAQGDVPSGGAVPAVDGGAELVGFIPFQPVGFQEAV